MNKYFFLINLTFLVPIFGTVLFPSSFNYNYLPPIFLVIGLQMFKKKLIKNSSFMKSLGAKIFLFWVFISILFSALFYDNKVSNLLNCFGIIIVHMSVIYFLNNAKNWTMFLKEFCWFIFWFILINIFIQSLPIPLGEVIFEKISGWTEHTTQFAYITLWDSIKSFPNYTPASFPTYRNHGVAFLATLGFATGVALMIFPEQTKENRLKNIYINMFTILCFICIFFSYSRTAFIAVLMIGIASMYINKRSLTIFLLIFLATLPLIITMQQDIQDFLTEILRIDVVNSEKTGAGRELIWELHSQLFALKPLTGWGWILPYEDFGYDITKNPFSESGLTFVLVTQGLLRGSLFILLMVLAISRNLLFAKRSFYHALLSFICIFLFMQFLFQGSLVGATSSIGACSQALLAIALYSEPIKEERWT